MRTKAKRHDAGEHLRTIRAAISFPDERTKSWKGLRPIPRSVLLSSHET